MVLIRPLQASDLPAFRLWRGGDEYKNHLVEQHWAAHQAGERVVFVAADGARLAGTCQFVVRHQDPELGDGETTAYLEALEVQPQWRQQGVGTRLMEAVEREASNRGFGRVALMVEPDNLAARALYAKLGYVKLKDSFDTWRDKEYPVVCLVKLLATR